MQQRHEALALEILIYNTNMYTVHFSYVVFGSIVGY